MTISLYKYYNDDVIMAVFDGPQDMARVLGCSVEQVHTQLSQLKHGKRDSVIYQGIRCRVYIYAD